MPRRIQRRRTAGWRMPTDAIYVGRPTRWGNPFRIERGPSGSYITDTTGTRYTAPVPTRGRERTVAVDLAAQAAELYALHVGAMGNYELDATDLADLRATLGGHDLACWCPIGQPCHADTLLELANP